MTTKKTPPTKPINEHDPLADAATRLADADAELASTREELEAARGAKAFAADHANFAGTDEADNVQKQLTARQAADDREARAEVAKQRAEARRAAAFRVWDEARRIDLIERDASSRVCLALSQDALVSVVPHVRGHLREGFAHAREELARRNQLDAELREEGIEPRRPAAGSLVEALPALLDEAKGDDLLLLLNLGRWLDGVPARAREAAENAARMEEDRRAGYERSALAGHLGDAERLAAQERRRQSLARFYGTPSPNFAVALQSPEVEEMRLAQALNPATPKES